MTKNIIIMDITIQLLSISHQLTNLMEDMDQTFEYIDNAELYNEINNNIKSRLENALTHLEIAIDDINDGMYENPPMDEEDSEWD
jgi:hypothetical protein